MTDFRVTDAAFKNLGLARGPLGSLDASAPVECLLEQTTRAFEAIGMPLASRWAETLVAAVLDVPHEQLKAHAWQRLNPEQRRRFEEEMREKMRVYGESYPLDVDFLDALGHMPEASGIALGLDRLAVLATGAARIEQVLWAPVPEASR